MPAFTGGAIDIDGPHLETPSYYDAVRQPKFKRNPWRASSPLCTGWLANYFGMMAGTGLYLDLLKTLVRLWRQLNSNWVASSYFTSGQDDPHNTGLADYVTLFVTVKNCRHQAGSVVV